MRAARGNETRRDERYSDYALIQVVLACPPDALDRGLAGVRVVRVNPDDPDGWPDPGASQGYFAAARWAWSGKGRIVLHSKRRGPAQGNRDPRNANPALQAS